MPFSHHSHSGQFCGHATDTLASIVEEAVCRRGMLAFHLTEHCPRGNEHLYQEEISAGVTAADLEKLYDDFVAEAVRLRSQLRLNDGPMNAGGKCHILIGFEAEWIDPSTSTAVVHKLLSKHGANIDYFIGSVHHVRGVPIDFDRVLFEQARRECGGSDIDLFHEYFDAQFQMLDTLKPKLVGHFDLIRLFADDPDQDLRTMGNGSVWQKILRNLDQAKSTGAVLEINTAALRKGLKQPYPRMEVCEAWKARGGQFVLSDDSHGISHIGTNYPRVLAFLDDLALQDIAFFSPGTPGHPRIESMSLSEVKKSGFWELCK